MRKKIMLVVLLCFSMHCLSFKGVSAQGVIPVQRYISPRLLDRSSVASSFAYSLRKIRNAYTGFAVRVRRGTDNAEADVSFDGSGIVSSASNVTITASGTSGLTIGQVLTYSSFMASQTITVKIWYDQGKNGYNATQNATGSQPQLSLNTAGASNNKPSVVFNGTVFLDVGQPIENIVNNGINGSFFLWTKPTANVAQESFGCWQVSGGTYRWAAHLNWSDGNLYFDAGETCCGLPRAIANSSNLNIYKQYSFVRGTSTKTVRINSTATVLNNTAAASTSMTGLGFYIGWAVNGGGGAGYRGNICEAFIFPSDLDTNSLLVLETDQNTFWSN